MPLSMARLSRQRHCRLAGAAVDSTAVWGNVLGREPLFIHLTSISGCCFLFGNTSREGAFTVATRFYSAFAVLDTTDYVCSLNPTATIKVATVHCPFLTVLFWESDLTSLCPRHKLPESLEY